MLRISIQFNKGKGAVTTYWLVGEDEPVTFPAGDKSDHFRYQ